MPIGMRKPITPTTTRPPVNLGSSLSSPISPQPKKTGTDFSVVDTRAPGVNLDTGTSSPLTRFSRGSNISIDNPPTKRSIYESLQQGPRITPRKVRVDSNNIDTQIREFGWRPKGEPQVRNTSNVYNPADMMGSRDKLLKIYRGEVENATDLQRWAARRLLNKPVKNGGFGLDLPKVQNMSEMIRKNVKVTDSGQFTNESRDLLESMGYTMGSRGTGLYMGGFTGLLPGLPSMTDTIPAMLARGEFVVNSLSTKLFRPFLHYINDNAGKVFSELVNSINKLRENTEREENLGKEYYKTFKELADQIKELKDREEKKKIEELLDRGGGNNNNNNNNNNNSNNNNDPLFDVDSTPMSRPSYKGKAQRRKNAKGGGESITPNKKQVPVKIQTYRRGKGGGTDHSKSNNVTTINMTKPAINLAGQQTPNPPTTSSVSSSPSITISPIDMTNEYNMEFFRLYEIV